jgi:hypothetical protein
MMRRPVTAAAKNTLSLRAALLSNPIQLSKARRLEVTAIPKKNW